MLGNSTDFPRKRTFVHTTRRQAARSLQRSVLQAAHAEVGDASDCEQSDYYYDCAEDDDSEGESVDSDEGKEGDKVDYYYDNDEDEDGDGDDDDSYYYEDEDSDGSEYYYYDYDYNATVISQ